MATNYPDLSGNNRAGVTLSPPDLLEIDEVDGLQAELDTLETDINTNEAAVAALDTTVGALDTALDAQIAAVDALDSAVTTLTNSIDDYVEHPGYVAGRWYSPFHNVNVAAGAAMTASTIYLAPFRLERAITVSDLGARITTAVGASNVQLAIYAADATTFLPTGNALITTASISGAVATVVSAVSATGNVLLNPGWYWTAINADAAVAIQTVSITNAAVSYMIGSTTHATLASAAGNAGYGLSVAQAFDAWPSLTAAVFADVTGSVGPIVHLKAA